MFFGLSIDDEIQQLEEYLNVNDIPYKESLIKEEFDKFDSEYEPLRAKCKIGVPGYSKYTDFYIEIERNKILEKMIQEYPGMQTWARSLKIALLKLDSKIISNSGMVLGYNSDRLLPSEIVFNEQKAREYLASLRIKKSSQDIFKKK